MSVDKALAFSACLHAEDAEFATRVVRTVQDTMQPGNS
jgi:hypothetical protein